MKYLRGSADLLTGRAVIFLDLKEPKTFMDNQVEMGLMAVFCAASEVDLLELIIQVMRLPREHSRLINRFYKRYFQEIEEIKRSFPERISKIINEILEEEEEKQEVSEPIREAFREMFNAARKEDIEQPEEMTEKTTKLPQPEFYSTIIPLPYREFFESYAQEEQDFDFDIIDLERKNALTELSSELMFLIETGRETGRVFGDLKQLTAGSHLMGQVVSLYNISTTQDPNKIKLMDLYFRKIFSLIDEDYLLTKNITEEIQKYTV